MEYSKNNFLTPEECLDTIKYIEENGVHFSYTKDIKSWYCKRVPEGEFSRGIVDKFFERYYDGTLKLYTKLEEFDIKDFNISLTKYYDGRFLNLHLDQGSQLTSVVVLSDNFKDGRFLLSDSKMLTHGANEAVPRFGSIPSSKFKVAKKIHLKKGEILTFNGTQLYHGVMPVTEGIRYSLNIWMTNTDYKFLRPAKLKSAI